MNAYIHTQVMCCVYQPPHVAMQTMIQPMKKHNDPSEQASDDKQNNQTKYRTRKLSSAQSHKKHDPGQMWTTTTSVLLKKNKPKADSGREKRWFVSCVC